MRRYGCCRSHQETCVQAQVTIHTSHPGSLCSPPLPGSSDPGTTSWREHTARLRLLQSHPSFCRCRLAPHSVPLPPPGLSEPNPLISFCFNSVRCERRTDTLRRPTCRGRAKSKAGSRELCEQRREREISPSSLRGRGLNLHSQLDVPCICEIPE